MQHNVIIQNQDQQAVLWTFLFDRPNSFLSDADQQFTIAPWKLDDILTRIKNLEHKPLFRFKLVGSSLLAAISFISPKEGDIISPILVLLQSILKNGAGDERYGPQSRPDPVTKLKSWIRFMNYDKDGRKSILGITSRYHPDCLIRLVNEIEFWLEQLDKKDDQGHKIFDGFHNEIQTYYATTKIRAALVAQFLLGEPLIFTCARELYEAYYRRCRYENTNPRDATEATFYRFPIIPHDAKFAFTSLMLYYELRYKVDHPTATLYDFFQAIGPASDEIQRSYTPSITYTAIRDWMKTHLDEMILTEQNRQYRQLLIEQRAALNIGGGGSSFSYSMFDDIKYEFGFDPLTNNNRNGWTLRDGAAIQAPTGSLEQLYRNGYRKEMLMQFPSWFEALYRRYSFPQALFYLDIFGHPKPVEPRQRPSEFSPI